MMTFNEVVYVMFAILISNMGMSLIGYEYDTWQTFTVSIVAGALAHREVAKVRNSIKKGE